MNSKDEKMEGVKEGFLEKVRRDIKDYEEFLEAIGKL